MPVVSMLTRAAGAERISHLRREESAAGADPRPMPRLRWGSAPTVVTPSPAGVARAMVLLRRAAARAAREHDTAVRAAAGAEADNTAEALIVCACVR